MSNATYRTYFGFYAVASLFSFNFFLFIYLSICLCYFLLFVGVARWKIVHVKRICFNYRNNIRWYHSSSISIYLCSPLLFVWLPLVLNLFFLFSFSFRLRLCHSSAQILHFRKYSKLYSEITEEKKMVKKKWHATWQKLCMKMNCELYQRVQRFWVFPKWYYTDIGKSMILHSVVRSTLRVLHICQILISNIHCCWKSTLGFWWHFQQFPVDLQLMDCVIRNIKLNRTFKCYS